MSKTTLSAIVSGFPPELRSPRPLPGETMAELVIRNHPQEWLNCVERLRHDLHASGDMCSRLQTGDLDAADDPAIQREIERFMNLRLPTHGRTLQGLAELRGNMRGPGISQLWQLDLVDIIWPRQKDPSGNRNAERLAESLGVVDAGTDRAGPIDLGSLLGYVHGEYLWILPGGTRLDGVATMTALIRVLNGFKENRKLALYSDGHYCMIYRTEALRALMSSGHTLSAELQDNARMLQQAGFELAADDDPGFGLVKLEPLYGGQGRSATGSRLAAGRRSPAAQASRWRRLWRQH